MKLRTRILFVGLSLVAVTSLTAWLLVRHYKESRRTEATGTGDLREAEQQVEAATLTFKEQVQEWKNVLLRGHLELDRKHYWQALCAAEESLHSQLSLARKRLELAPPLQRRIDACRSDLRDVMKAYERQHARLIQTPDLNPRSLDGEVRGIDRAPNQALQEIQSEIKNLAAMKREEWLDDGKSAFNLLLLELGFLFGTMALSFAAIVDRWLTRPLWTANRAAQDAAQGNLDKAIPIQGVDEARELLVSLESMRFALRKNREEISIALQEAQSASRAKSAFLDTMSHELRTPLNGVLGMIQLLQEKECDDESRDFLESAQISADALLQLINNILEMTRQDEAIHSVFDPRDVLRTTLVDLSGSALSSGLKIHVSIDDAVPVSLKGDQSRFSLILTQLVSNAIKFNSSPGFIGIKMQSRPCEDGRIMLACEVEDDGLGIAEEKWETIFDRFVQVDDSMSRQFGGTGIGLSLVRSAVDAMDGRIEFESRLGAGSCFRVELPLLVEKQVLHTPRSPQRRDKPRTEEHLILG